MQAIQYIKSIPRYLAVRSVSHRIPAICTSPISCIQLREIAEPDLPNERWAHVKPILSGICGSDLATIRAEGSTYFSPLTSTPFVLGHEVVGILKTNSINGMQQGTRVVVEPALGCKVRGIAEECARCREGHYGNCENVAKGDISPGIQTGYCRDTGGGWSECFIAHESQLHAVPDEMSNEEAVLIEPFSCALHAALRFEQIQPTSPTQPTILVIGCGSMGLLTIAALRAIGIQDRMVAVYKHDHQGKFASTLGVNELVRSNEYDKLARTLNAEALPVEIGLPTVIGGADVTFDCIGSSASINDALRFTRAGGKVILVGMPGVPKGVDWTAIWHKELRVQGSYTYGWEEFEGRRRRTFEIAIDLMRKNGAALKPLVTHQFPLADYKQAIQTALHTGPTSSIKTVFDFR